MVLQLLPWKESACDDVDCPPGFEVVVMVTDDHAQSSSNMSSLALVGGNYLVDNSLLYTDHMHANMTSVSECVEHELHSSAKESLEEYLESFVEEEVRKYFDPVEDDNLNEVTCKVFSSLYYLKQYNPTPKKAKKKKRKKKRSMLLQL